MYVVYCQNKPKSEHIVSEYIETFFEVSLAGSTFLLAPMDLLPARWKPGRSPESPESASGWPP